MKLYTEEQLINTVEAIRDYLKNYPEKFHESMIEKHLKNLEPIELPSDEEQIEVVENKFGRINPTLGTSDYRMGYESGLFDVVKLIQGGNNEKIINKITGL